MTIVVPSAMNFLCAALYQYELKKFNILPYLCFFCLLLFIEIHYIMYYNSITFELWSPINSALFLGNSVVILISNRIYCVIVVQFLE